MRRNVLPCLDWLLVIFNLGNIVLHLHPEFFSPLFNQLQRIAQNSTNLTTKTKRAGSSQSVQTTSRPLTFYATKSQQEGAGLSSRKDSTAPSTSTETGPTTNKASVTWAASSGSGWTRSTDWQARPTTNCELSWRTLKATRLTQSTTRLLWQTKQTTTGWAWRAIQVTSFRKLVILLEWTSHLIQLFKRTGIRSYWQPWNAEWHNSIEWRNLPPEITCSAPTCVLGRAGFERGSVWCDIETWNRGTKSNPHPSGVVVKCPTPGTLRFVKFPPHPPSSASFQLIST